VLADSRPAPAGVAPGRCQMCAFSLRAEQGEQFRGLAVGTSCAPACPAAGPPDPLVRPPTVIDNVLLVRLAAG
jgi:hypothetical protein